MLLLTSLSDEQRLFLDGELQCSLMHVNMYEFTEL